MTPELLRMTGEAVFGPQWQASMARALNISTRHVSRMMNPDCKDRPTERLRPILIDMLKVKVCQVSEALQTMQTTDIDGNPLVPGIKQQTLSMEVCN